MNSQSHLLSTLLKSKERTGRGLDVEAQISKYMTFCFPSGTAFVINL